MDDWPPVNFREQTTAPNPLAHRISFVEIMNPGNQIGYGWRCACAKGLLCAEAFYRCINPAAAYMDVIDKTENTSMFSLAIPMYNSVIHRVTVVYSTREDWDGSSVHEFIITIPTGLGDQTRFYLASDWFSSASNPISEVMDIVGAQSLFHTREGELFVNISENFATGKFRSTICSYRDHTYGSNAALQRYLSAGPHARDKIIVNAFCLMHKGMCIICANNNELALMVPSDV